MSWPRLQRLLPSHQLLSAAEAQLEGRAVWLALASAREKEHVVFIFTRGCWEQLFCVIPVVANVRLEVMGGRCAVSWHKRGSDLLLDVDESSGILQQLQDAFLDAAFEGLVFHEEQSGNHREVWGYRDYLPLELAKLPAGCVEVHQPRRTRKERAQTMRELPDDRRLRLLALTWNVAATAPPDSSLEPVLDEEPSPDLCVVGFQETCQLSARRLLADGTEWEAWQKWADTSVKDAYEGELQLLESARLVGLLILVFVRSSFLPLVENVRCTSLGIGVGGMGGNKGAVAIRLELGGASFCFVNVHLAAGQENYIGRCQHYNTIIDKLRFDEDESCSPVSEEAAPSGLEEDISRRVAQRLRAQLARVRARGEEAAAEAPRSRVERILDHDHVVLLGDTNSRLHWPGHLGGMPIAQARQKVQQRRFGELLALDQLTLMRRDRMAFHDFEEQAIHFVPSYKWRPWTDSYDMRSQKHVPAWTDRILHRSRSSPGMSVVQYRLHPSLKHSDHRLVFASLRAPGHETLTARRRQRPTAFGTCLEVEPKEISFEAAKPDVSMHRHVQLSLVSSGLLRQRFQVCYVNAAGELWPMPPEDWDEEDALARWLRVAPHCGVVRSSRPTELSVSLCVGGAVLRCGEETLELVLRVGDDDETCMETRLSVRVQLEPSVLRAPLDALAKLGRQPLLGSCSSGGSSSSRLLPPKELLSVMQWVLIQSRDMPPGTLEWWDPLKEHSTKTERELREVQRYVEHGWAFPRDTLQLSPVSATFFLLKCLEVLPEPLLPAIVIDVHNALRSLPELSRCVLLTVLSFFGQLEQRHGGRPDFWVRLVVAVSQSEAVEAMALQPWLLELRAERRWPPLETIQRYS